VATLLNPIVQGVLASFTAGIGEELLMRLLVMGLISFMIVGIARLIKIKDDWKASSNVIWVSIILVAVLFGLGHFPSAATSGLAL
jgi:membrane protease YdiL (CAAX protease family)